MLLLCAGGDLHHFPLVAVRGREYASEGTLDRLPYVSYLCQAPGPSRQRDSFVRVFVVIGSDVIRADVNGVVGTGLLHPQLWEGHQHSGASGTTRVPDVGRCLCRLLWRAEI